VVGNPPDSVEVRLRGSSAILSRLQPGEVVAMVDLQQARPGSRLFPIQQEEVRSPYGVEVAQVLPGTLGIELEKTALRTVPVVAQLDGEPAPGFVIGTRAAEPAMVEIAGPESRVKKIANATTEPVSIAGARVSVRDVVAVGLIDASLRLTKPQNVTVIVDILPAPVDRELRGVLVRARNLGSGLAAPLVRPASVRAVIRGRREVLAEVQPETIDAFVDLAGLGPGQYNLRVRVDPSQQFGVDEITPTTVDVTIRAIR
jgi:YbbR domain-containing protein